MASTRLSDVIVPEIYDNYRLKATMENSKFVQSGAVRRDPLMDQKLAAGGYRIEFPYYKDLDDTNESEVGTTNPATEITPDNIGTFQDTGVRLVRTKAWSSMDLTRDMIADDPMLAIASRTGAWWGRDADRTLLAIMTGAFADNAAAPSGSDTHTQNDMTNDLSTLNSSTFQDGLTNFTTDAYIDTLQTMGDASDEIALTVAHSVVVSRMLKLKAAVEDTDPGSPFKVRDWLGRPIINTDRMPNPSSGVYETWFFGLGAIGWGLFEPEDATETERKPAAGNGTGEDRLYNRNHWCLHLYGNRWIGSDTEGGPANSVLDDAASWSRRVPERKQVAVARLISRES